MNRSKAVRVILALVLLHGSAMAGEVSTIYVGETNGGVTLDSVGDIYAANYGDINAVTGSEFVWKISPTDAFAPLVYANDINIASGNDFDSQDNLYQSNFGGDSISKIDVSGIKTALPNVVDGPVGIAIDDMDNVYVNGCLENTIYKIEPDGTTTTLASGAPLNCPNGMTLAPNGDLYIINWHDGRILRLTAAGTLTDLISIAAPGGHLTIVDDRLYATSFGAHQIFGIALSGPEVGTVEATIGSGAVGSAGGSYTAASFDGPNGITVDATGEVLYVTDQTGVRKVVLEDEVAPPPPPPPPAPPPPPTRSGGGGGGSFGVELLLVLGSLLLRRRRVFREN